LSRWRWFTPWSPWWKSIWNGLLPGVLDQGVKKWRGSSPSSPCRRSINREGLLHGALEEGVDNRLDGVYLFCGALDGEQNEDGLLRGALDGWVDGDGLLRGALDGWVNRYGLLRGVLDVGEGLLHGALDEGADYWLYWVYLLSGALDGWVDDKQDRCFTL
jgi:hypothetical protein